MSKKLPNFLKVLTLCKNGHILLILLLEGPTESIQDIISTVEDFCGIADLKTRISLFRMSFMSKTLPKLSKILHLFKIGPILLLILLGVPRVCPRHKIHSGRLLWDREFGNTYFTVLKEFHVEIIT